MFGILLALALVPAAFHSSILERRTRLQALKGCPMRRYILVFSSALFVTGCTGGEYRMLTAGATEAIQAPAAGKVGEPMQITLVVTGADGCWKASRLDTQVDDSTRVVNLMPYIVKDVPRGVSCPASLVQIPVTGTFTPKAAGTYHLKSEGTEGQSSQPKTWTADVVVAN